jgi:hypothetical protein
VAENLFHHPRAVNDGDDPHAVLANGAAKRIHVPDLQNQVAGGEMGMRGGAVCHRSAISAGHSALRIPRSALGKRSRFKVSAARARAGSMVRVYSSLAAD